MNKVLPFGSRVVCTNVDRNGYWGRELHPEPTDVGFHGVVISNFVMMYSGGSLVNVLENARPGHLLTEAPDDAEDVGWSEVQYTVLAADGRKLELMEHEIEALPSLVHS